MNLILFLFIFPIATIIFSIALQKILKNPFLVSAVILAIFLIVTFTVYGINFLIAAFIYALIALITAYIVKFFEKVENRTIQINLINNREGRNNNLENDNTCPCNCRNCNDNNSNVDLSNVSNVALLNALAENNPISGNSCNCNRNRDEVSSTEACRTCNCQRQFMRCLRGR